MTSYSTENDIKHNVSIATLESLLVHDREIFRRLITALVIETIILGLVITGIFYFFTNFELSSETVTIDSHQGAANYIGNDGDIVNGSD